MTPTQVAALRAAERALRFYANPRNWRDDDWGVRSVLSGSGYGNPEEKARVALRRVRAALAGETEDEG